MLLANSLVSALMIKKSLKQKIIFQALCLYSFSTLISQAVMSIGAGILGFLSLFLISSSYFSHRHSFSGGLYAEVSHRINHRFKRVRGFFGNNLLFSQFFFLSLFFAVICVLSLIQGRLFPLSFGGVGVQVHFFRDALKIWYFFLPFGLFYLGSFLSKQSLWRLINFWILCAFFLSLLGIYQFFTGFPRPQGIPLMPGYFHVTLFLGHHLSVSSILIFPFFASLALGLSSKFFLFASAIIGLSLMLTYSRMLWIALPIGLFIFLMRGLSLRRRILVFVLGVSLALGLAQFPAVWDRVKYIAGIWTRVLLWQANLQFFLQRPILGIGWRKSEALTAEYYLFHYGEPFRSAFVGHAHNNCIEVLAGLGIIGFLAYLFWNYSVLSLCQQLMKKARVKKEADFAWGVFCAWIVFVLNGLTQVNFWEGKVQHQIMWSIALILLLSRSPHKNPQSV